MAFTLIAHHCSKKRFFSAGVRGRPLFSHNIDIIGKQLNPIYLPVALMYSDTKKEFVFKENLAGELSI